MVISCLHCLHLFTHLSYVFQLSQVKKNNSILELWMEHQEKKKKLSHLPFGASLENWCSEVKWNVFNTVKYLQWLYRSNMGNVNVQSCALQKVSE